jgi:hypothetical protein
VYHGTDTITNNRAPTSNMTYNTTVALGTQLRHM